MTEVFDSKIIDQRAVILEEASKKLKEELYGMDDIIDKVINSIRAWYTFPQLIRRPVIVNLWGLTGVGKTQLVRSLSQYLNYQNKFVEVQMDGVTSSSSNHETTIVNILSNSSIEEGEPGILLLDEFQRYRAIDKEGGDVKTERFQDVWMLLSDGKFSANASLFKEIEMMLAYQDWSDDYAKTQVQSDPVKEVGPVKHKRKFLIYPYEARNLKRSLKLTESLNEIMMWDTTKLMEVIEDVKKNKAGTQLDYTKLLIFVSGNLDEAYAISNSVNDCDTDADIFYEATKKISVTEIKKSLASRFRPEQISRLGNNHIIYPSIRKSTYQKLIKTTCDKYTAEMSEITKIKFDLQPSALDEIYDNSVYPAQGTRPVFSSVHKIFSDGLVQIAFWAIKNEFKRVKLWIDIAKSTLNGESEGGHQTFVPIDLDIRSKREKASEEFKTVVAVHEAGHALVYAILTKNAPAEVKINTASYNGGYMMPQDSVGSIIISKKALLDRITTMYAGTCAEVLVFGPEKKSNGCHSDIAKATAVAASMIRQLGMDGFASWVGSPSAHDVAGNVTFNTNIEPTNATIEAMLETQRDVATQILSENRSKLIKLVDNLLTGETLNAQHFADLFPELNLSVGQINEEPFSNMWSTFKNQK